ncbi:hypothetical protein GGR56DRAFT_614568 [Xylariaceae sp. FL0804]|nr:hypothetical protein GGR56DRAFT_614568 [Xylariaceae sp. FL0804]
MAANYGHVPQSDNDDDREDRPWSPPLSLSPTLSGSPMPFLNHRETAFTPLSLNSDLDGGASASGRLSVGDMAQSLRGPSYLQPNHAPEYVRLSPDHTAETTSEASSSPNPNTPDPRLDAASDAPSSFASNVAGDGPDSPTSRRQQSTDDTAGDLPLHRRVVQQPEVLRPTPLVRTASTKTVSLRHPTPDPNTRSSSHASNIAQLEATAERLSMTSSIDDAIRDLHEEQKRTDSRRSSVLAASIASIPETGEPPIFATPISRQVSAASSILDTNSAARQGGYSPAAYVMSPSHSLVSNAARLRSGSVGPARSEPESDNVLPRHAPGKSSIRSVRSGGQPTLTNIAEMEPTTLNPAAMDEADRLAAMPEEDEILQHPYTDDIDRTPNAGRYQKSDSQDYWNQTVSRGHAGSVGRGRHTNRPPSQAGSVGTYEQAELAFADFDGAHCSPDADMEDSLHFENLFASPTADEPFLAPFNFDTQENQADPSRSAITRPNYHATARPTSYLDPETGDPMLFYPARVPMMLNLPQKLSKKPKAEARNNRRSQILSAMTEANGQPSPSWLPELVPEPPFNLLEPESGDAPSSSGGANTDVQPTAVEEKRQSRISVFESDKRNSRMSIPEPDKRASRLSMLEPGKRRSQLPALESLPPQLRASAFFDLPSESSPPIQLKDGSAMATLDSILDASAKAPVSAFTDHAFAGTLGSEVYGLDKKRKSHMKRASAADLLEIKKPNTPEPKKRNSFFHLRKPSALSVKSSAQGERRDTLIGVTGSKASSVKQSELEDAERQHLSETVDGETSPQQEGVDDDEESEDEAVYNGAPTTLLAELQQRKLQQKLRTRPLTSAFPNGMHSTLLELDTVAEIERKARKNKKVNLAWEDPNANTADGSDDEDTPLAVLMAAKGHNNGALNDIHRMPGLMEQREMEDNEPLSVRRNRLHGTESGPIKRMTLGRGPLSMSGMLATPSPQPRESTPEDDVEGETLGERMRRLRGQNASESVLPKARPVSSAFSVELLSQLGDTFKEGEQEAANKSKGKEKAQPTEEEETLGQRRRRLQAEREARERETSAAALTGSRPKVTKRRSLADILGSRSSSKVVLSDPRADIAKARQEEAAQYERQQSQRLAAFRTQMPANLSSPNLNRSGGYMSGHFNDGGGGRSGYPRNSTVLNGFASHQTLPNPTMLGNNFGMGGSMSVYGMQPGYGAPMGNPYGASLPMQPPGQMNRVEQWRQSVYP